MKKLSTIMIVIFALAMSMMPALAFDGPDGHHESSENDTVINVNEACVENDIKAEANTGENLAGGSYGGDGGDGGDVEAEATSNLGSDNSAGAGGTGGDSGIGGTVYSGNATARAGAINLVNTNRTSIDRCCGEDTETVEAVLHDDGCCGDEEGDGDAMVINRNGARLVNDVEAEAETGENQADGSEAGKGDDGGDLEVEENSNGGTGNTAGDGGNGGSSADGGLVQSGAADSASGVVNVVNRNVTRIRR